MLAQKYSGLDFKLARIKAGIKVIDLSKNIGVCCSKLSMIEHGHIKCPDDVYSKLGKILEKNL